jgi:hypothetical protein
MLAQHKVSEARGTVLGWRIYAPYRELWARSQNVLTVRPLPVQTPEFHCFVRRDDDERDRHIEESVAVTGTSCNVGVELDPRGR